MTRDSLIGQLTWESAGRQVSHSLPVLEADQIVFPEDARVRIVVGLPDNAENARLWLGEQERRLLRRDNIDGKVLWETDGEGLLFINSFGESQLAVSWLGKNPDEVSLGSVEILAKKVTSDRARAMLSHISTTLGGAVESCFARTRSGSSGNEGHRSTSVTNRLTTLEGLAGELKNLFERLRWRYVGRLEARPVDVDCNESTQIGPAGLVALLEDLALVRRANSHSPTAFRVRGQCFEIERVRTDRLHESGDTYENRTILGFLVTARDEVAEVDRQATLLLNRIEDLAPIRQKHEGYTSYRELGVQFFREYFERLRQRARTVGREFHEMSEFLERQVGVSRPEFGVPVLTPGFARYDHYRRLYELIVRWQGERHVVRFATESHLLGLRSLDRLFEFYCLVRLLTELSAAGWSLDKEAHDLTLRDRLDAMPLDQFRFRGPNGTSAVLYYEPRITPTGHPSGLVDVTHAGGGPFSYWCPDFVIEVHRDEGMAFVILDAKYKSIRQETFRAELPELTFKYLHGIGRADGRAPALDAMLLLFAGQGDEQYYQNSTFDVYGRLPNRPVIGALPLTPGASDPLAAVLRRVMAG